jgi:hypothetical protein
MPPPRLPKIWDMIHRAGEELLSRSVSSPAERAKRHHPRMRGRLHRHVVEMVQPRAIPAGINEIMVARR